MNSLSFERVSEVLRMDMDTGRLFWLETTAIRKRGEAGYIGGSGYRIVMLDGKNFRAHRLVWLMEHRSMPAGDIDHINGDKLDNRPINLRDVTRSQNNENQSAPRSDSASLYLGVTWDKPTKKWRAQINVNKKHKYLGIYATPELARDAYMQAKREMHTHGNRGWG